MDTTNNVSCYGFFDTVVTTNYDSLIHDCEVARESHFNVNRLMNDLLFVANQDALLDCY